MLLGTPTTLPNISDWQAWLADPTTRTIVYAALGLIILVIVLRIFGRRREAARWARRQAELRETQQSLRLRQEEIKKLADQIWTTSSTHRVAGFTIVRQVDAVFTEGKASSVAAMDLVKALAARMGANAIINLETRQGPNGKWYANGDAVVVKNLGGTGAPRSPADETET
jgi:uncharacterized protein YbjQ (UPF0145 family)